MSLNPNTMYPLLRGLESSGFIEGRWEHPEKRSRRLYTLTAEGRAEYDVSSRAWSRSSTPSSTASR